MLKAGDYRDWVDGLPEDQRALALAAGLDRPPDDGMARSGHELRDTDGLPTLRRNGRTIAAPLRATSDSDSDGDPLAAALRAVMHWVVGNASAATLFTKPQATLVRLYVLSRLLQIGDFGGTPMAAVARTAGVTRAALSKAASDLRRLIGTRHFCAPGDRPGFGPTARRAALRSWAKRKDLSHLSQTP